jgi:hypothetical protein
MKAEGGSKGTHIDPDTVSVHESEGSSSELSLSIASNTTLKDLKTTDAERKKERQDQRAIKTQIERQEKRRKKSKGLKTRRREKKLEESKEKNEPREGQLVRRKKK